METLHFLATGAIGHAMQEHGCDLTAFDSVGPAVTAVDEIVAKVRSPTEPAPQRLVDCYGAWFGMQLLQLEGAQWVGLNQALPPRILLAGRVVSPFDAVRRSLESPQARSLESLYGTAANWTTAAAAAAQQHGEQQQQNAEVWNGRTDDSRFAGLDDLPANQTDATAALDEWLASESIAGRDVLCLAAGGGRQGPLHALAGAHVTVVDISAQQLALDQQAAKQLELPLTTICTSMTDLTELPTGGFDVVVQPVSTCYAWDLAGVYAAVARVLRPGGCYMVQHKNPIALRATWQSGGYWVRDVECRSQQLEPNDDPSAAWLRETGTIEFAHTNRQLIGGLCRAGFVIEAFDEPVYGDAWAEPGTPAHRNACLPPYLKIKARRIGR